jgi:hypothetical protein
MTNPDSKCWRKDRATKDTTSQGKFPENKHLPVGGWAIWRNMKNIPSKGKGKGNKAEGRMNMFGRCNDRIPLPLNFSPKQPLPGHTH